MDNPDLTDRLVRVLRHPRLPDAVRRSWTAFEREIFEMQATFGDVTDARLLADAAELVTALQELAAAVRAPVIHEDDEDDAAATDDEDDGTVHAVADDDLSDDDLTDDDLTDDLVEDTADERAFAACYPPTEPVGLPPAPRTRLRLVDRDPPPPDHDVVEAAVRTPQPEVDARLGGALPALGRVARAVLGVLDRVPQVALVDLAAPHGRVCLLCRRDTPREHRALRQELLDRLVTLRGPVGRPGEDDFRALVVTDLLLRRVVLYSPDARAGLWLPAPDSQWQHLLDDWERTLTHLAAVTAGQFRVTLPRRGELLTTVERDHPLGPQVFRLDAPRTASSQVVWPLRAHLERRATDPEPTADHDRAAPGYRTLTTPSVVHG